MPNPSYSIDGICKIVPCSRPTAYKYINEGKLKTFTVGRRRYVTDAELNRFLACLESETVLPKENPNYPEKRKQRAAHASMVKRAEKRGEKPAGSNPAAA